MTNVLVPAEGTLTLGGGPDYVCQVVSAVIAPDQATVRTETMCEVVTTPGRPAWTMTVDYLQDWTSTGISTYLHNHGGETVAYVWEPTADGTPKMVGSVVLPYPSFGGTAGQHARDRVALPCTAKPTLTVDT